MKQLVGSKFVRSSSSAIPGFVELTPRELQAVALVAEGKSNPVIAQSGFCSQARRPGEVRTAEWKPDSATRRNASR
jgi:hypothetical protein